MNNLIIKRGIAKLWSYIGHNLSDEKYLPVRYKLLMEENLNLKNPTGFNQKLNWLKVYYHIPLWTLLADKSKVKDIISPIIGEDKIIPTYGVWQNFDEIDFDKLPDKFVLKSINGGGGTGVYICRDKSQMDLKFVKHKLEDSANTDFKIGREWVYYDIPKGFIAEKLIGEDREELLDYKIMCFNGEPKILFLASDRYAGKNTLKFDWYDMELNHLPIQSKGYLNSNKEIEKFPQWEDMKFLARKLATELELPYVRVDFYLVKGKIFFGELTFFHDGAFVPLIPHKWEDVLGSWIKLPQPNVKL